MSDDLSYEDILALLEAEAEPEPEPEVEEPSVLTPEERAVQDNFIFWMERVF